MSSGPSQVPDPYALMGIVQNPNGSITRDATRFPRVPPTPDPSPLNPVASKDILVNHIKSTWMRLYVPTTALNDSVSSKKLPLVVYYHGGGFITCGFDVEPFPGFCELMARELNVVVASPSYRLAPEFKLPAAYEDGEEALEWLRNSSEEDEWIKSHADLSNVYLMGSNAGGNLAYNVGVRSLDVAARLSPLRICGLILHYPLFGGRMRCESELRHENDQVFPTAVGDLCWELCLPDGEDRDHEYSNPTLGDRAAKTMRRIERLGWKVMVSGGGGDPMIDRQRDLASLMKETGIQVVERFIDDGDVYSGDELEDPSKSTILFDSIRSFISSPPPLIFSIESISYLKSIKEAYIEGRIADDP